MILTSFYFSIAGMAGLVLYAWYRSPEKLSVGKVIHFFVPMGVAVISGGVLLVPTACALLQRSGSSRSESLTDLLMPDLCLDKSLYNPYSVGLTMLLVTALLAGILCGKIRERLVSVIGAALLVLPVFAWGFNGALYVRYKSLIPFLPLFCYLIAVFLRRMKEGEIGRWKGLLAFAATVGVSVLAWYLKDTGGNVEKYQLIVLESVVLFGCCIIFQKWKQNICTDFNLVCSSPRKEITFKKISDIREQ